jgi:hypothetical protein
MGNAFSAFHTVFHITLTFSSILVIKWVSFLISRGNPVPKNGINVIKSSLPMTQKLLFLYGLSSDSENSNSTMSTIYINVILLRVTVKSRMGMKRETNDDIAIADSLEKKEKRVTCCDVKT